VKILYVSHYFPPEMGAPAGRVAGLARQWVREGHEVDVLTGFPHHPTGIIPAGYRGAFRRGYAREDFHGVRVHRTWIFPAANRGKFRRSLNYLSFMLSAAITGSLRLCRPDVVIATSPQLLCAGAGFLLSRRFGAPLVMEVRDLWPESLVAVGAGGRRSPLVVGLERLAKWLYRSAHHVVTVTEAQRAAIEASGIPPQKLTVIPNGIDAEFARRAAEPLRPAGCSFVVTYAGTLGMAHHLETLLEAAHLLRGEHALHFQIVGEGARRSALEERARQWRLHNVTFTGERPREEVPRWLGGSDVCVVLLRRTEVFLTVVPSKMLEIMSAGRPLILGVAGEAKALLERAQAGIAIDPENAQQLADAILALRANSALANRSGESGRRFVAREFNRELLARKYLAVLQGLQASPFPNPQESFADSESVSEA
jgi:glycosyltransferase involved in cell wall biosynthesis